MSDGGESRTNWLANPSAILALVTLFGGLWLVSQRLTSDRPVPSPAKTSAYIGDQKMEARLWEDPFKRESSAEEVTIGLPALIEQIDRRVREAARPEDSDAASVPVRLLPVMISGGQYGEDRESRIRSRFAIVSALGRAGYAPEDAEHLGKLEMAWPTHAQTSPAKRSEGPGAEASGVLPGVAAKDFEGKLDIRFEWYRFRVFGGPRPAEMPERVLVLWLDDGHFEADPLLRLALFFEPLTRWSEEEVDIALIGPRRSSTLRAMLPNWRSGRTTVYASDAQIRSVLSRISLFCATPSAMDEVLVRSVGSNAAPRATVKAYLEEKAGFRAFHNYSATDAQMAADVLAELALRGVDPANEEDHIVLISEWDTFYGRMLSLTYGLELAYYRAKKAGAGATEVAPSRAGLLEDYVTVPESKVIPGNFRSFVYLRGLDGQTVATGGSSDSRGRDDNARPDSLEKMRTWSPDVNKAEGPAQFDYLGRVGERLADLQRDFRHAGKGRIAAIGIVGSDVYDLLLILQALRQRFPSTWFFTTDLDVRLLDPEERAWARNLIAVSSYGLTLDPEVQGPIAPFRDSTQTAQFAAVLGAVGHPGMQSPELIAPRRFEIGNRAAVDLSVDSVRPASPAGKNFSPHPPTAGELHRGQNAGKYLPLVWGGLTALLLVVGATWMADSLRRLTWKRRVFVSEPLLYADEDVGGQEGAVALLKGLSVMEDDEAARWLLSNQRLRQFLDGRPPVSPVRAATPGTNASQIDEAKESDPAALLAGLLNTLLIMDREALTQAAEPTIFEHDHPLQRRTRERLDRLLNRASVLWEQQAPRDETTKIVRAALQAARTARKAARKLHWLHGRLVLGFWIWSALFLAGAAWLAVGIWRDTFQEATGEPFSLVSGISAWPAVAIRCLVIALAIWFAFALWHRMRTTFLLLTRMFRFRIGRKMRPAAHSEQVCAEQVWSRYLVRSSLRLRAWRVIATTAAYFVMILAFWNASGEEAFHPTRGAFAGGLSKLVIFAAAIAFMLMGFLALDVATLCRKFINELGAAPTQYPLATRRHFARQMGNVSDDYLDEWIDLQLIAELTERVGRLIYYPTLLVMLLIVARNDWWDAWPWPLALVVCFGFNFVLALAGIVVLQRAAKAAKRTAERSLTEKVRMLRARLQPTVEANDAARGQEVLAEIRKLHRGAFVPFWENPVVGAIFLSSSGTTVLQLFIWFMAR